jgi:hypothetical protein
VGELAAAIASLAMKVIKRTVSRGAKHAIDSDRNQTVLLGEVAARIIKPAKLYFEAQHLARTSANNSNLVRELRRAIAAAHSEAAANDLGIYKNLKISYPEMVGDSIDSAYLFKIQRATKRGISALF